MTVCGGSTVVCKFSLTMIYNSLIMVLNAPFKNQLDKTETNLKFIGAKIIVFIENYNKQSSLSLYDCVDQELIIRR